MKIYKVIVGTLATNCYVVASEKKGAFIIDPGDDAPKIREVLSAQKLEPRFIVNTHGHIDHIKANAELGLPVYVHESEEEMIACPEKNIMTTFFGTFSPVRPARLLKDADELELDELTFKVLHTPGHTRGCICLLGGGVLFSGDTLFRDGVGRTDLPGASHELLLLSLEKLSGLNKDMRVYPGHGPETTIGRELGDNAKDG
ncbi:MAG TPA: MBL fold metallo-hydrolase [Candidatus Omnitrophica bacterium]|nr:MBL fold metallo-hydrolase [Candidatus Omnitrophota bacterium]